MKKMFILSSFVVQVFEINFVMHRKLVYILGFILKTFLCIGIIKGDENI
jgi:hypothetical protein